jgi:hypothetical protein
MFAVLRAQTDSGAIGRQQPRNLRVVFNVLLIKYEVNMSFKNYVVWCDKCSSWTGHFGQSLSGIRKEAKKVGWLSVGGMDFCSECSKAIKKARKVQKKEIGDMKKVAIYAPNLPFADHLKEVTLDMLVLGVPEIRAIWCEERNAWYALEGSHRIAAAQKFGLVPMIIDVTGKHVSAVERSGEMVDMSAEEAADWVLSDLKAPKYTFGG